MAQNIIIAGNQWSDVPSVEFDKVGGGTTSFADCSVTTATASDVAQGKVFVANDGTVTTGTASGGGGSSSWTKIAETSYQVSTTQTSSQTVATLETGSSELWTSAKWVYVRVRDTAGKRDGYFYGIDQFFYNIHPANGTADTSITSALRITTRYSSGGVFGTSTTGYGVYADALYSDGSIRIRKRYNSTNSLTVNGTYKVEVYLLNTPDGVPIFG